MQEWVHPLLRSLKCLCAMRPSTTVVCNFFLTRIGPRWSYRGFAYKQEQDECLHITFQMVQPATRAKMCPTTCVVQQNDTSRKGCVVQWFQRDCIFVGLILLFERRTHDVTCRNMHVTVVDNLCCEVCTVTSWFRFWSAPFTHQTQNAACRNMRVTFPTNAGT